jgi:hypothetical protein
MEITFKEAHYTWVYVCAYGLEYFIQQINLTRLAIMFHTAYSNWVLDLFVV